MKNPLLRAISIVSRISPRLGGRIAWYLWFHPHGRANTRYPDGAERFTINVFRHEISGYSIGDGEPVLLLHGWGGASTDMAPLASALAEAGYRAVAPDLPGHGSDRGSSTDLFRMAATVDATVNQFGLPRSVVAHSFGAVVTFAAFAHGGPERVVLIAPAVTGQLFIDAFKAQLNLSDKAFQRFEDRFVAFAGPHLMDLFAGKGDVRGADMLVLHDPADDRTPFAEAAAYAASRPATKLIEVPDTGHKGILRDGITRCETVAFVSGG
ncbi:MAG: alpha/beta fold hydrolase [Actinomycetota bacterium]|nr:alpha/beta fold hydrolase [Actinomycetota bacterium]